jgi:hypothetical protein
VAVLGSPCIINCCPIRTKLYTIHNDEGRTSQDVEETGAENNGLGCNVLIALHLSDAGSRQKVGPVFGVGLY